MPSTCPFTGESEISLPALIGRTRSAIVARLEQMLAEQGFDLNFTQYLVLKHLAHFGELSATELARNTAHDAGAMTRVVDKLSEKGYVRRNPSETDRRAMRIELSEAGRAVWSRVQDCADACIEACLHSFTVAERKHLASMLARMITALDQPTHSN
ncbi:MAG: MarR family transcriptional regulator [Dokdonella sp.]